MTLLTNVRSLAALIAIAALSMGCGSGLSTEEATQRCDQERTSQNLLFTDAIYAECVSCYEECGDDCDPQSTTPLTYVCPAE
jgi:hypothetical protein